MNEEVRHFSLRKLSVGLASVLVGVSIFGASQTVKADTVVNDQTSSVTNNAQSNDTQENKNAAKSSFSNDNQANNAKSNATQTQENEQKQVQTENIQQDSAPQTQEATDSNELQEKSAEKNIVSTSSLQKINNQSNDHAEDNSQTQTSQKLDLTKNSKKLAKSVDVKALAESKVATDNQFNFDDWTTQIDNTYLNITGYKGDRSKQIVVPNGADFAKAGKNDKNLQVEIDSNTLAGLIVNGVAPKLSNTDGQKIVAEGSYWSGVFSDKNLHDISGLANLDTSNIINMSYMFSGNQISDLSPLANWDTSSVTNMNFMFYNNSISDLTPLAHWNTSKVGDMESMFSNNQISALTSLSNWDVSNVTNMIWMFGGNSISNLTSLANWNTSSVTKMSNMFYNDHISDLTPLAHWNTSKVTDMSYMFSGNQISDLSPLAHWDTSSVININDMFYNNPDIIDLKPIANWNIGLGASSLLSNFSALFEDDAKLNLTNINNTPLMQSFLKEPDILGGAIFITNNADLVKATTGQDLPNLTNTAKRTITFNIPNATPKTIVQTINYKAVAPVQIDYYYDDNEKIVQTYPVKESDWQLDTSKQNDAIVVNGQIRFASVKIPHVNGYKAYIVQNKSNPALFTVSFVAIPTENKPSTPAEETPSKPSASTAPTDHTSNPVETAPSKPSAPTDRPSNSAWTDLKHKVVNALNQSDSGWTMPADNSTYKVDVPVNDAAIDLSDLVIAQPVHAQTRTQIHVTKRFKLRKHGKKHAVKHFKQRKKVARQFRKYRL